MILVLLLVWSRIPFLSFVVFDVFRCYVLYVVAVYVVWCQCRILCI